MNLDTAKNLVKQKLNIPSKFIYKGIRNQTEEFEGEIIECFPSIFLIRTDKNIIKSFSYNDFIIKNIIIKC